jgi:hypothetical protein
MAAVLGTSETDWINRFLTRLDQLDPGMPILGAISFALKRYNSDPQRSPEEAAESYARERPM